MADLNPNTALSSQSVSESEAKRATLQGGSARDMTMRGSAAQQARHAVLLAFREPFSEECLRLRELSEKQWRGLLRWLDTSGLALYFVDRIQEVRQERILPAAVLTRLRENLRDNAAKMDDLVAESSAIHREFQRAHVRYATMKGFSLWPHSVPKPWLRSQLDLDFLIAEEHAAEARRLLEQRGYRLHAISGQTWEFKTEEKPGRSLRDLYKPLSFRCVELHLDTAGAARASLLKRTRLIYFEGVDMPVLSAADVLVGQAMHLLKHAAGEFLRAAHLVEFYRHVLFRRDDLAFWADVVRAADEQPGARLALGFATRLTTELMGEFAPAPLRACGVSHLPNLAGLWIALYGRRVVLSDFPGSKLYLLLQRALQDSATEGRRPLRRALVPMRLPPQVVHASQEETAWKRVHRYCHQAEFVWFRMRFHLVEGLRYVAETFRWSRRVDGWAAEEDVCCCARTTVATTSEAANKGVTIP